MIGLGNRVYCPSIFARVFNSRGFNMKITEQKNGDYTTFERVSHNGYYIVKLYKNGNLADKIMTDTYQAARDYLRSFNLIAKNG